MVSDRPRWWAVVSGGLRRRAMVCDGMRQSAIVGGRRTMECEGERWSADGRLCVFTGSVCQLTKDKNMKDQVLGRSLGLYVKQLNIK